MDQPSPGYIDQAASRRLEQISAWREVHYAGAYQRLHPQAACRCEPIAGGYAVYVAPGSPLNRAVGLGLDGPVRPADFAAFEAFFQSRGVAPRLDLSPLADESLLHLLAAGGYAISFFFSVLVRAIPAGFAPSPLPPGLSVTRASPEQAGLWLDLVARGFEASDRPSPEALEILSPNFYAEDSACFLAWIDGQPAGGGGMYLHGGGVELGGASTLPAFRRRGVQRALIEARLADARDLGCDLAVILTEPGSDSQRNAERAGFRLAYTKTVLVKQG